MPHYCQLPLGCPEAWLGSSTTRPPSQVLGETCSLQQSSPCCGPCPLFFKIHFTPLVVPLLQPGLRKGREELLQALLKSQTGQRSCMAEPPARGLSLFMLPRSLVQMAAGGKEGSTPSSPERLDKGLQRDAHKGSLPISLFDYLSKEWKLWAREGRGSRSDCKR